MIEGGAQPSSFPSTFSTLSRFLSRYFFATLRGLYEQNRKMHEETQSPLLRYNKNNRNLEFSPD